VADALRAEGCEVAFVGGERAEAELVPAAGYPLRQIAVEGLVGRGPLRAARALAKAAAAVRRSRALLRELRPDAVMGGGGYVAGPVGLAAVSMRVPLVLTEADSHLGLANRLLSPFARRVCLSFPVPGCEGARYRVTGRPIPVPDADRDAARERFGIAPEQTCLLVFGGSLGSRTINRAALDAFASADRALSGGALADDELRSGGELRVLHVCGRRDYAECSARELPEGYDLREYLSLAEFAQALAAADLVLARAGGSVFEIAAYGRPAILVPYPHAAGDHQTANARWMADAGAAIVVEDEQLSAARLAREVAGLLADRARLAAMAAASRALARPSAALDVAAELRAAAS
jgi:UDP-N-acetylglucosamine--N-acetylmuramyl-(pentapeptide) pyrophosphoryl-undecaprenol N-acetylglucosamine transferase